MNHRRRSPLPTTVTLRGVRTAPLNAASTTTTTSDGGDDHVEDEDEDEDDDNNISPAAAVTDRSTAEVSVPTFRLFYNDVYEVELPPRHRFPMGKYRKVRERVQERIASHLAAAAGGGGDGETKPSAVVDVGFCVSPLSTFEELSTTHDPTYIRRFLEGDQTPEEQRNVGFPWSRRGVDRALSSVGGTLAAARFVCEHERRRGLRRRGKGGGEGDDGTEDGFPAWAAHIAGGTHHAFYDRGEGFSVFSDMAVAANVVLEEYPDVIRNNILMIDLDVHQGNGNAVLFRKKSKSSSSKHSDRVFTFSMHCAGNYFSRKQESDLDIELPVGCKDQAYLMTLHHWLKRFRIEHRKPREPDEPEPLRWDLVIFQAGVDVLEDDRLGRMALSPGGVARRNELVYGFVRDLGVPLVICMGGGYPKKDNHGDDDGAWESILETHSEVYFGAHRFLDSWLRDDETTTTTTTPEATSTSTTNRSGG